MAAQHSTTTDFSSRYKFNGKELDQETGCYYGVYPEIFGRARYYNPSVSRWLSVDPLAEKYTSFSPYNFTLNNPVRLVDFDGRSVEDIIILYNDKHGDQQRFRYNGTNGADAPDNAFVNSVLEAGCYNSSNGGGFAFDTAANDSSVDVLETYGSSSAGSRANGSSIIQVVQWNPAEGDLNEIGNVLSPATILEHEIDHVFYKAKNPDAYNSDVNTKDNRYDNKEERRVITGNETITARANGEIFKSKRVSRNNHSAGKGFKNSIIVDGGPTSTKINKIKSAQHQKKLIRNQTSWSSEY